MEDSNPQADSHWATASAAFSIVVVDISEEENVDVDADADVEEGLLSTDEESEALSPAVVARVAEVVPPPLPPPAVLSFDRGTGVFLPDITSFFCTCTDSDTTPDLLSVFPPFPPRFFIEDCFFLSSIAVCAAVWAAAGESAGEKGTKGSEGADEEGGDDSEEGSGGGGEVEEEEEEEDDEEEEDERKPRSFGTVAMVDGSCSGAAREEGGRPGSFFPPGPVFASMSVGIAQVSWQQAKVNGERGRKKRTCSR